MAKASDNVFPYVHVAPAAAPSSPSAGSERLFLDSADGNKLKRKDSSGTVVTIEGGSALTYASFSPTLTATTTSPTLGTGGSVTGRYFQSGKHVVGDVVVQFGTSGAAAGTGTYLVSLPVAASTALGFAVMGSAYAYRNSGGTLRTAVAMRNSSTAAQFALDNGAGTMSSAAPWAWANNDLIVVHFAYEAA